MAYVPRPNSGSLFHNNDKEQDNQPDYKGDALIKCPHCAKESPFWLSGWTKQGRHGDFFSLALKPKEDKSARSAGQSAPTANYAPRKSAPMDTLPEESSDIPF